MERLRTDDRPIRAESNSIDNSRYETAVFYMSLYIRAQVNQINLMYDKFECS